MINKKNLIREQQILQKKGFYKGELDGIWGPSTIAAKKEYESSSDFLPGIPNKGLPLKKSPPYPKDIYVDSEGLLNIRGDEISNIEPPSKKNDEKKETDKKPQPSETQQQTKVTIRKEPVKTETSEKPVDQQQNNVSNKQDFKQQSKQDLEKKETK